MEQHEKGVALSDTQWNNVQTYMLNDRNPTFRQLCTAFGRYEAHRGRKEATDTLRRCLEDPDGYVVASTLAHLVKWLKVPDGAQLLARFEQDPRAPVRDVVENLRTNPPESESFQMQGTL
ncbi:MAG TPA: hypothetical protein VGE01_08825 [Fimbriimonas sp.]